jgi:hypothetical protein
MGSALLPHGEKLLGIIFVQRAEPKHDSIVSGVPLDVGVRAELVDLRGREGAAGRT